MLTLMLICKVFQTYTVHEIVLVLCTVEKILLLLMNVANWSHCVLVSISYYYSVLLKRIFSLVTTKDFQQLEYSCSNNENFRNKHFFVILLNDLSVCLIIFN